MKGEAVRVRATALIQSEYQSTTPFMRLMVSTLDQLEGLADAYRDAMEEMGAVEARMRSRMLDS